MSLLARDIRINRGERCLLAGVDLELSAGEILAVVGPNGAGKSTLLGALAGDLRVDAGRVELDGQPLAEMCLAARAQRRAVVGPPPQLAFDFSVQDVVGMGWLHGERYGPSIRAHALEEVLRRCELDDMRERVFMSLSSGERQRAQFAAGWLQLWPVSDVSGSRCLLLDEPTANLDVAHALRMLTLLREIAMSGLAVMVVLHVLDLAARFADRVLLLEAGRVVSLGAPESVMNGPSLSRVYGTPIHVEHLPALDRLVVVS